jgi:nucleotide-binding universal stress UspA family protein
MSEIIVAIDFSECSINALEHAVVIANKAELDVLMVWVQRSDNTKFILDDDSKPTEDLVEAVKKKFDSLIRKYKIQLKKSKIEYAIRPETKVYKEIVNVANERKAILIITGTHGASGFEEFWIGSNANRMVSAASCPIITIRAGRKTRKPLRKIVMPIDSSLETRQKVPFTAQLASLFGAEVNILGLYTSNAQVIRLRVDNYVDQVAKYLDDMEVKYKIERKKADNLTKTTLEYANEIDANLISIMSEQETSTSNLWYGSYAQQMVNHSPIPVLTIKAKEYIRSLSR